VGKVPFDVFKDFTPVTQVANVPFVLAVNNAVPAKNVAEFIAWVKQNPGKVNYASSGNGSPQHLAAEMLSHLAGLKMQHVPYKGAVPAITDLIGGQVQLFIGAVNSLLPQAKENKLRILAGAGAKRYSAFPDLPAISETVPGFGLDVWLGVFMPAGVPKEIVAKTNADIARALAAPEIKASLAAQGLELVTGTPDALATIVREDYARWGRVIREANIKAD
jgi:tripartite-type tricarboxylate transporter receptor subunit TctC